MYSQTRHVGWCRIYADDGFSEHPKGTNFPKTDSPGAVPATVYTPAGSGGCTGGGVRGGGYPGYGWWRGGRVLVPTRGTGPGCHSCTVSPLWLYWDHCNTPLWLYWDHCNTPLWLYRLHCGCTGSIVAVPAPLSPHCGCNGSTESPLVTLASLVVTLASLGGQYWPPWWSILGLVFGGSRGQWNPGHCVCGVVPEKKRRFIWNRPSGPK